MRSRHHMHAIAQARWLRNAQRAMTANQDGWGLRADGLCYRLSSHWRWQIMPIAKTCYMPWSLRQLKLLRLRCQSYQRLPAEGPCLQAWG